MKYDFEIDREIVKLLITKGDSVYDADILKYLKKSLRREISPVTYSSHKKVLLDEYIISKTEEGERGRIKYELSKRATQQHRLGILRFNLHKDAMSLDNGQPQEERNLKIFFLILANAIHPVLRQKKRTELLPGFNGREVLNNQCRPVFRDSDFREDEIEKSFDKLDGEFRQTYHKYNNKYGSPIQEFLEFLFPISLRNLYNPSNTLNWLDDLKAELKAERHDPDRGSILLRFLRVYNSLVSRGLISPGLI